MIQRFVADRVRFVNPSAAASAAADNNEMISGSRVTGLKQLLHTLPPVSYAAAYGSAVRHLSHLFVLPAPCPSPLRVSLPACAGARKVCTLRLAHVWHLVRGQ